MKLKKNKIARSKVYLIIFQVVSTTSSPSIQNGASLSLLKPLCWD